MHPLKQHCKGKRGRLKQIAANVHVRPTYLSQIIMGIRRPSPDLAVLLEKETGISRMALLYPEENRS
jgi:DNA-binding transcriptional regulator YdaS (Cro superfamily)